MNHCVVSGDSYGFSTQEMYFGHSYGFGTRRCIQKQGFTTWNHCGLNWFGYWLNI